jgi:hypothetical protein
MKKILNEDNEIHNFISSSGGTVISYGSGSDFFTSYGSGSTSQKVTVPTVPVPVPQHCAVDKRIAARGSAHGFGENVKRNERMKIKCEARLVVS